MSHENNPLKGGSLVNPSQPKASIHGSCPVKDQHWRCTSIQKNCSSIFPCGPASGAGILPDEDIGTSVPLSFNLSGGPFNIVANDSLGGLRSTARLTGVDNSLFHDASVRDLKKGRIDYRAFYVYVENYSPKSFSGLSVYLIEPSEDSDLVAVPVELAAGGVNVVAPRIPTERTPPDPAKIIQPFAIYTKSNPLDISAITDPGDFIAVWVKKTIVPNSDPKANGFRLRFQGNF